MLIFLSKIIYLFNKSIGLNLYYFILSKILISISKKYYDESVIFHFQDVVSLYYFSKFFLKNKNNLKILTVHGDLTNMNLSDKIIPKNSTGYFYSLNIEKTGYEVANKIIAVDQRLKNHVLSFGISEKKIRNFPNFTDIFNFYPLEDLNKKNDLKKEKGICLNKKILFCPRRLVEKNGVIYTIDIISKISNDFMLVITGEGPEKENVLNRINELNVSNKVILTGDIPNEKIREYYWLSDLIIIPSITSCGVIEATSISAIEAMACGIPVVASNIGGLKELIIDSYNGYLCEEKNIDEFVRKINLYFSLNNEEKEKIKNKCIKMVKENFSCEAYFNRLKEFIFKK